MFNRMKVSSNPGKTRHLLAKENAFERVFHRQPDSRRDTRSAACSPRGVDPTLDTIKSRAEQRHPLDSCLNNEMRIRWKGAGASPRNAPTIEQTGFSRLWIWFPFLCRRKFEHRASEKLKDGTRFPSPASSPTCFFQAEMITIPIRSIDSSEIGYDHVNILIYII